MKTLLLDFILQCTSTCVNTNNQVETLETKNFTAFTALKTILHHVFPPLDNNYHLNLILLELTRLS